MVTQPPVPEDDVGSHSITDGASQGTSLGPLNKQAAKAIAREANHKIRSKVRDNWVYNPNPETEETLPPEEVVEWREREPDEEKCIAASEQLVARDAGPVGATSTMHHGTKRKREALLDETEWNDGLRCFMARRDAWTGARAKDSVSTQTTSRQGLSGALSSVAGLVASRSLPSSSSSLSRDSSMTLSKTESSTSPAARTPPSLPASPSSPPAQRSEGDNFTHAAPKTLPTQTLAKSVLLPVPPPILPPDNPLRTGITPLTYNKIYNRIVIQGLSPSVPVNLKVMMRIIVQGWKQNDEWPPKSTPEEDVRNALTGSRKLVGKGVGRMKRALRLSDGPAEAGRNF